jgi:hypothetical protein
VHEHIDRTERFARTGNDSRSIGRLGNVAGERSTLPPCRLNFLDERIRFRPPGEIIDRDAGPFTARRKAVARPIPRVPPVISTVRFAKSSAAMT